MTKDNEIKIGDIFVSTWGYDQTNVDFYQVIARTAKMVTVRRINATRKEAHSMGNYVMPIKDNFLESGSRYDEEYGKAKRYKIQVHYDNEPCFRVASYAFARRWKGETHTETYTG